MKPTEREAKAIAWAKQQADNYGLDDDKEQALITAALDIARRHKRVNDGFLCNTLIVRKAQSLGNQDWSNVQHIHSGRHIVLV